MQEYRPELSDDELEQQREAFNAIARERDADKFQALVSKERALFSSDTKLTKAEKKKLKKMRPKSIITQQELGSIKSVGGVDYAATVNGWQKIGLTKV